MLFCSKGNSYTIPTHSETCIYSHILYNTETLAGKRNKKKVGTAVNAAWHFGHACQSFASPALYICIAWTWTTVTLLLPNSTKLYRASSRVRCLKAGKPMFAETFSFPSSGNWIAWMSNCVLCNIHLSEALVHSLSRENGCLSAESSTDSAWPCFVIY